MKEYKLLHLANHIHHNLFNDKLVIGGFYNWHRVFYYPNNFVCWDIHTPKKIKEEKPDFILIGLSRPENLSMLPDEINRAMQMGKAVIDDPVQIIKSEDRNQRKVVHHSDGKHYELPQRMQELKTLEQVLDSRPITIFHVDYAVQMWKEVDAFSPGYMKHVLEQCDFLFTSEPIQGHAMYALLEGRKDIYLIHHPTNIAPLKKIGLSKKNVKSDIIRTVIHRYDNEWYMPYLVNQAYRSCGYAFPNIFVLLDGNQNFMTHLKSLGIDHVEFGCQHSDWVERVAETYAGVDSYHWFNNYGRSPVEFASLNTPLIGSDCTDLQPILFPELTTPRGHVDEQGELLIRLVKDKKFYRECQDYAFDKVENYGYDASKEKFLKMVNGEMEPYWKAGRYEKYRSVDDSSE